MRTLTLILFTCLVSGFALALQVTKVAIVPSNNTVMESTTSVVAVPKDTSSPTLALVADSANETPTVRQTLAIYFGEDKQAAERALVQIKALKRTGIQVVSDDDYQAILRKLPSLSPDLNNYQRVSEFLTNYRHK